MSDPVFGAAVSSPFGLTDVGLSARPTFADIDGDGDLDAFVGEVDGNILFFRNIGSASAPNFIPAVVHAFGLTNIGLSVSPTFADIDGDGDLDAFVGSGNGTTHFFRNDGTATAPNFASEAGNFDLIGSPAFADIDGDGDLDVFVGSGDGTTRFFRNTGSASAPNFVSEAANFGLTDVGNSARPTFVDIDGDGDLDAFIGEHSGSTLFFRNIGSDSAPSFVSETGNFGLTDVGNSASPTFADIDGDGDVDAFVGGFDGVTRFFENIIDHVTITQSGGTAVTEGGVTDTYTVALLRAPTADVIITLNTTNHQVSADVAVLTFTPSNWNVAQTVTVSAVNDTFGEGAHTGVIQHSVVSADPGYNGLAVKPVVVAVTDNDLPHRDAVFGTAVTNPFHLSNVGSSASPTFADIDGDGDLDAFVGDYDGDILFFRNSGSVAAPSFNAAVTNPFELTGVGVSASPTFADIDGDGDLDAFVGNFNGNILFFRNSGSANAPSFSVAVTNPFSLTSVDYVATPTFADIDGDGDLDAFVGNDNGDILFFRNNGSGSAPSFSAAVANPFGLTNVGYDASPTFADIDGDGDLDAFVGNHDGDTLFFRNSGSASAPSFSAVVTNPFGLTNVGSSASPTFADIDGDGDLDAFVGGIDGDVRFFLNTVNPLPHVDFNGDGKSDIIFRNTDGTFVTWQMDGATATGNSFGVVGPSWTLRDDHGDYNGDGKSDLLWQNSDGTLVTWQMNGATVTGNSFGVIGASWALLDGHGDYNGDGKSDLLWQNTDGTLVTWQMNGAAVAGNSLGVVGPSWTLLDGHGDYNGDGKSDLLWQNVDGTLVTWQMNGATVAGNSFGAVGASWTLLDGHGDYNGDGKSDLLWQNTDGTLVTWQMNGATVVGNSFGAVGPSWSLLDAHGDYNGDGKSDLLWQNSDGTLVTWQMDGATVTGNSFGAVGASWTLLDGHADYNGDGKSDLLWQNADGTLVTWQMNGATVSGNSFGVVGPDWDIREGSESGARLTGDSGNNTLHGTINNDTLAGQAGTDTLMGNAGADKFVFNTALNAGTNVDTVTDFASGTDKILLDHLIFAALSAGYLDPNSFVAASGATAQDSNDRILYDTTNGHLSYDPDGVGGVAATLFANLANHPALAAADFAVV